MASRQLKTRLLRSLGSWNSRFRASGQVSRQHEGQEERILVPSPFIVGEGRSGTTLLRLMLDAHPDLAIPPETRFITRVAKACKKGSDPRRTFVEFMTSHRKWGDFRIEDSLLERKIATIEPFDISEALRAFYRSYAKKLGKPRWGDKTPAYINRMKHIQRLLPEARFIHIIRDGRDVALSVKDLWFGPNSVEEAAQRWRKSIEKAQLQSTQISHYLEIRYEDLVASPGFTLQRICDFIDLPWSSSMLSYYVMAEERISETHRDLSSKKSEQVVRGEERTSVHALTSKPPQHDRIGRWKREMTAMDRERFEKIAGETLRELGYEIG